MIAVRNSFRRTEVAAAAMLVAAIVAPSVNAATYRITVNVKNEVNHDVRLQVYDRLTLSNSDRPIVDTTLRPQQIKSFTYSSTRKETRFQSNRTDSTRKFTITQWPKRAPASGQWFYNAFVRPAKNKGTTMRLELYPIK